MKSDIQIVGRDAAELVDALSNLDYQQVVGLAAISPALANAVQGRKYRQMNTAGQNFGQARTVPLPMSLPGTLGSVATTAAVVCNGAPTKPFLPKRIIVGSTLPGVHFTSFTIGVDQQFLAATGSVPGEAFSALSVERDWQFAMIPATVTATLTGVNANSATNIIVASLIGESVSG